MNQIIWIKKEIGKPVVSGITIRSDGFIMKSQTKIHPSQESNNQITVSENYISFKAFNNRKSTISYYLLLYPKTDISIQNNM